MTIDAGADTEVAIQGAELWAEHVVVVAHEMNMPVKDTMGLIVQKASGELEEVAANGELNGLKQMGKQAEANLSRDEAAFAQVVDSAANGQKPAYIIERMMTTPLALFLAEWSYNAKNAESLNKQTQNMTIREIDVSYSVIKKMMNKHNLSPGDIKKLPRLLADPIAVFESSPFSQSAKKKSDIKPIVAMIEMRDNNGATVIVPVYLEEDIQGKRGKYNIVTSAYGRTKSNTTTPNSQWFINEANAGRTLYINNNKISAWANQLRVSFPSLATMRRLNPNITTEADLVKARDENQSYYQGSEDDRHNNRATRGMFHIDPETGNRIITLFKANNRSTFVHEIGHAFLADLHMMAEREAASELVKRDWGTIRNWLGMSEDQRTPTREQHEQFADGFLNYLENGYAPSKSLRGAFIRIKGWLREFFAADEIRRILISEEVSLVYDRLLAAPDEVLNNHAGIGQSYEAHQ
ncbi:MAG: hypothetical protein LBI74_00560 [Synergistaceae bacterium]|nr:hypothetical protein [Synergistaceae bacterium]